MSLQRLTIRALRIFSEARWEIEVLEGSAITANGALESRFA